MKRSLKMSNWFRVVLVSLTALILVSGLPASGWAACVTPPSGMVGWWKLNTMLKSLPPKFPGLGGTGVFGTVDSNSGSSDTLVTGKVSNALNFDGIDDYLEVPSSPSLNFGTGDFSIELWIKTTDTNGVKLILDKRYEDGNINSQGYAFYLNSGKLGFQLADGNGSWYCSDASTSSCTNYGANAFVADGNWHLVAVTVDRDSVTGGKFYVDGVEVGTFNPTLRKGSLDNSKPLVFGRRSSYWTDAFFKGVLDEVSLYNRVLTGQEIQSIYQAGEAGICVSTAGLTEEQKILKAIEDSGSARVIIGLNMNNFKSEGLFDIFTQVQAQRATIAQVQDQFLNSLPQSSDGDVFHWGAPSVPNPAASAKRLQTVPQVIMEIDKTQFDSIVSNPSVSKIWLDIPDSFTLLESTKMIGVNNVWGTNDGTGQIVVVIDTGVEKTHPLLNNRVIDGACFTNTNSCKGNTNFAEGIDAGFPCNFGGTNGWLCLHGTHVSGIVAATGNSTTTIKGVASGANIISINIASEGTNGMPTPNSNSQIQALDYVNSVLAAKYPNIAAVNMSMGGGSYSTYCDSDPRTPYIENLRSKGIAVIVSSGNNGTSTTIGAPACISSAISVGATNDIPPVNIASYSNSANLLDFLAPGSSITSSIPGGGIATLDGTSMAAPHVAGTFAVLRQKLAASPNEDTTSNAHPIRKIVDIIEAALKVTGTGVYDNRNGFTFPFIQVDKALEALNYHVYMGIDNAGEDTFHGRKTESYSGAAVSQMALAYLMSSGTPQATIYSRVHSAIDSKDLNADEVQNTLNNEVHADKNSDGKNDYNYAHVADADEDSELKQIVYWMDNIPNGGKKAPGLVPINGSYQQNWRVLRGMTTNIKPFTGTGSAPVTIAVTGFLLNNPMIQPGQAGHYVYQNINDFKKDYKPIEGQYRAVLEPPLDDIATAKAALANVTLEIVASKPNEALRDFLNNSATTRKGKRDGNSNNPDLLAAVKSAIPGELLANPIFPLIDNMKYVRTFRVDNLDSGTQYAIFALSSIEGDTANILVKINPEDGSFASATWTADAQRYPKVSISEAAQIAMQTAKNGDAVAKVRPVWFAKLETSDFHFSYEVTFTSGKIVYINSGSQIVEVKSDYIASGIIGNKSGNPIEGVTVKIGDKTAITDASGNWQITGLQEGNYTATASKDGYVFTSQDVTLSNGQNATVAIKTTSEPYPYSSGVFTVDTTGIVKIDWLYDGGKYQGEFGIFNLAGMENLTPGSSEFIAEAVKRVLSNFDQGYLVFSDLQEGARFSGILGGEVRDWNTGDYKGVKSLTMKPGSQFATMLVPNSTFASLAQNPATTDTNKRPLFSLVSSNPVYGMYLGQMADVNGMGKAYSYEDKDAATSDKDFNDLIVMITGATADLPSIDDLKSQVVTRAKRDGTDWRTSELGRAILEHVEAPAAAEDSLSMTVTFNTADTLLVYDPNGNVMGKDGGWIAGAAFEMKADGTQIVTLPNPAGTYRLSIQGAATAQSTLTVKTYQGSAEISSAGIPVDIAPHQILTTTISAEGLPPVVAPVNAAASYDFNGDGITDNADVSMLVRHWNSCKGQQKYDAFFDVNDDGCITVADIMTVLNAKTVK